MNARTAVLFIMVAACLLVTPGLAATYKPTKYMSPDGTVALEARVVEVGDSKAVASGKAHVRRSDPTNKAIVMEAYAEKIVVTLLPAQSKKTAKGLMAGGSIKSVDFTGSVKMVYAGPDSSGAMTKMTACADTATFDGATNMAYLVGNVRITNENPSLFAQPAVMAGDKATVNLSPNLGPDAYRFRVESSPGVSSVTVTPKAKETQ